MTFAFWRKCDFQVHTPRDPNWSGARPLGAGDLNPATGAPATAGEIGAARAEWADGFVDACAARGLGAVALTDHHETVMVPYVREAILRRQAKEPGYDLWLFPGMELTCQGGVQCLILFDADLTDDWCQQAQGRLGIVYTALDPDSARAPKVTQISYAYPDIAPALDEIAQLRGRYIVLPNVSNGGHSVLREGEYADFRRMPYVGGYLDRGQTWESLYTKNKRRLSGADPTWTTRRIYPLPTSDSRSADFAHLGTNETWIKLAAPSAEAIRQAFLGNQSRIRVGRPEVTPLAVARIEISGSSILRDSSLSFSPELNSIIGGRGSGKSSLLEYVSFGLGRSCLDLRRDEYSGSDRMEELIKDTLVSKGGTVTLTVIQDGAEFRIVRGPATAHQPQVTYPNGDVQTISVRELRSLFPAVVYSQGELAEIGKQTGKKAELADLLQFVNPEYKVEDDRLSGVISSAKSAVRVAIERLAEFWKLKSKIRKLVTKRDSLKQRVEALEKTLPELSPEDQQALAYYDKAADFEAKRLQASKHATQLVDEVAATSKALAGERDLSSQIAADTQAFRASYAALVQAFTAGMDALANDLVAKRAALAETERAWVEKFAAARKGRDAVLEKLGEHKSVTAQIIKLREEMAQVAKEIGDLEDELKAKGDPAKGLTDSLAGLRSAVEERATRTSVWAKEIEGLSSGKIKATVHALGDTSDLREAVDAIAGKTGSQEATRARELEAALAKDTPWDVLDRLRSDCLALLYWHHLGGELGEQAPRCKDLMKILGDTDKIRAALNDRIDPSRVEAIACAAPRPQIALSYCDGAREISFEKASEGQRAAALLLMLLEQSGGTLIIDQPEGDLDNRIITDLTDKLHSAKEKRQIMFASHNANIVVNGSSELVAHLEVAETGARGFECAGAIDDPHVCKVITGTMEGGEKAFRDRQDEYGY